MFLDRIYRSSSFRLTFIFSIVFCLSLSFIVYFIIWSSAKAVTHEIDENVSSEIREILNETEGKSLGTLAQTVAHMSARSPRFFYLLQNAQGKRLAGNMPTVQPILGVRKWRERHLTPRGQILRLRGFGLRAVDGAYLFVGLSAYRATAAYHTITRFFLWMMASVFGAVVIGGLFISNRLLHRVELISRTSREIVSGNLQRRVPVLGTNDEFDHLAISLNVMLDRIVDLMDGLRQVSSDIAHDLRTPLTHLRQRLEHARDKAVTTAEFQKALDQSISQVDSILAIFSSLLRIAQIESGVRRSGFKTLNLSPLLIDVTDLYRPVIDEKKQNFSVAVSNDLNISGDSELLRLLFINILDNATKHAPALCAIEVKGHASEKHVIVEIADGGVGIPSEFKGKVFDRFYRLEQSRSAPGYGLGLSVAAAVATLHDATLELLDNAPGLRVRITFFR